MIPLFKDIEVWAVADINQVVALEKADEFYAHALTIEDSHGPKDINIVFNFTISSAHFRPPTKFFRQASMHVL